MVTFPIPSRDRLLLVLISRALYGDISRWFERTTLADAIRAAEQRLPKTSRCYFFRDGQTSNEALDEDIRLLDHLAFIEVRHDLLRLSALGDSSTLRYELSPDWEAAIPLIQKYLMGIEPSIPPEAPDRP